MQQPQGLPFASAGAGSGFPQGFQPQPQQQQQPQPQQQFAPFTGHPFAPFAAAQPGGTFATQHAVQPPQHGTVVRPFNHASPAAATPAGTGTGAQPSPASASVSPSSLAGGAPAPLPSATQQQPQHQQPLTVTVGANPASQASHLKYDPVAPDVPSAAASNVSGGTADRSPSGALQQQQHAAAAAQAAAFHAAMQQHQQLQQREQQHHQTGSPVPATAAGGHVAHVADAAIEAANGAEAAPAPEKPLVQLGKLHQGAAVLLRAEGIEELRFMATHHGYTCPRQMRKQLTKQYRECDQIVVLVAIGDAIAARAVMASDVIPRGNARKTIPDVEAAMPAGWTNVFRVTCAAVFDAAALDLHLPCPVSDRSELPSQVPIGFVVPRVWNATLHGIVDSTVALASGKAGHYDALLKAVRESDPEAAEVPPAVAELVAPVRMVSHGPGVVALGYVARYFGRQGRQFIANSLFGLQSGVIDLCRQTMGGCLIAYLVRHGTCATPRILQLVPWKVVASRVLSDAVGSQTASLMLHSALQFHRSTRRSIEPVALTSLTHRVLTKNLADATDPQSDWSLSAVASNAQSCRVLQLVVEACVDLLAMHASGEVEATPEIAQSAQKVVNALCDLAAKHALDPWSNYATQSLITACTLQRETTPEEVRRGQYLDSLLARVMVSVRPTIEHLSCHKSGSNVVEKLCKARPGVTVEIAAALVEVPGALGRLVADRFGNYVVQTLLQHLPPVPSVEERLRAALTPLLRTLDPHWHCAIAIDTWLRKVAARLGPLPGAHQLHQLQQQLAQQQPHNGSMAGGSNNSSLAAAAVPHNAPPATGFAPVAVMPS